MGFIDNVLNDASNTVNGVINSTENFIQNSLNDLGKDIGSLENAAKQMAKESMGLLLEASVLKDYQAAKINAQYSINVSNSQRKQALNYIKIKTDSSVAGKNKDAIDNKINSISNEDYYNDGSNSIQAYGL